jgi:hypothetical protein
MVDQSQDPNTKCRIKKKNIRKRKEKTLISYGQSGTTLARLELVKKTERIHFPGF